MLIIPPSTYRRRSRESAAAIVAPTLMSASFDSGESSLTLTFDRAIDVNAIDGSQIVVNDGDDTGSKFDAGGGVIITTQSSVVLSMKQIGQAEQTGTWMTASGQSGIVAIGGGEWAGCGQTALPFQQ